ncbi:hypothetical protein ACLFMI_02760 [Pseudonocardia nantongensis]|uniref:hypothetical protein n=1 Tax=Pseudonocardia nantongensis TaxID=1181885 RepID=UPI00397A9E2E
MGWDPRWHELIRRSDPTSSIAVDIRTSDPLPEREPGPVTLIDDAAHRTPVATALGVTARRTGMRLVNRVPALRRRMARGMQRVRDSELV